VLKIKGLQTAVLHCKWITHLTGECSCHVEEMLLTVTLYSHVGCWIIPDPSGGKRQESRSVPAVIATGSSRSQLHV